MGSPLPTNKKRLRFVTFYTFGWWNAIHSKRRRLRRTLGSTSKDSVLIFRILQSKLEPGGTSVYACKSFQAGNKVNQSHWVLFHIWKSEWQYTGNWLHSRQHDIDYQTGTIYRYAFIPRNIELDGVFCFLNWSVPHCQSRSTYQEVISRWASWSFRRWRPHAGFCCITRPLNWLCHFSSVLIRSPRWFSSF